MICFQSAIGWSSGAEGAPHVHVQRLWVHHFPSKARHWHFTAENAVEKVENKVEHIKKRLTSVMQKWMIRCFLQSFRNQRQTFFGRVRFVFFCLVRGREGAFFNEKFKCPMCGASKVSWLICLCTWIVRNKINVALFQTRVFGRGMMNDQMVSFRRS